MVNAKREPGPERSSSQIDVDKRTALIRMQHTSVHRASAASKHNAASAEVAAAAAATAAVIHSWSVSV